MLYINQLDFRNIKYYHNADNGGPAEGRDNVATSGCGLCCMCMIVEHLTKEILEVKKCVKLSEENGANRNVGTSLDVLANVVAPMYDIEFSTTNSKEELLEHLKNGGEAIANVSGDREGCIGLFTYRGHYITVVSVVGDEVCILDPSYTETKFDEDGRRGRVRIEAPYIYCDIDILMEEASNRNPGFYLFKKRKDL